MRLHRTPATTAIPIIRAPDGRLVAIGHRSIHPPTFLLAQGMTLEDVKNQLGHSTIVLKSNAYGHVLEQRQRQVARGMDAVLGGWGIPWRLSASALVRHTPP